MVALGSAVVGRITRKSMFFEFLKAALDSSPYPAEPYVTAFTTFRDDEGSEI